MKFDDKWEDLAGQLLGKLQLPDDTPIPTPADVAGGLLNARLTREAETWTRDALEKCGRRMDALALRLFERDMTVVNANGFQRCQTITWYVLQLACADAYPLPMSEDRYMASFQTVHDAWQNLPADQRGGLKHPLAALIEGWLLRPEIIRPDVDKNGRPHKNGFVPKGLFGKQPATRTVPAQLVLIPDADRSQLPDLGRVKRAERQLPLFADLMADEDLPVTPLILANAAGFRGLQPGRGARLDKRLLIFGLLSMPRDQRRPGGRYEWRPTLREIRDLLWPARPAQVRGRTRAVSSWRPSVHATGLYSALQAVNLAEVGLPDGDTWRPMRVWRNPDIANLDREAIIEIRLPGASDRGPQVDKIALAAAGVVSDPAFDLELGLAYLWDDAKARTGGHSRIRATRPEVLRNERGHIVNAAGQVVVERGRPATRWDHPQAVRTGGQERHPQADRVRVLIRKERRLLAYGPAGDKRSEHIRQEQTAADRLLEKLETAGRIVIERDAIDPRTGRRGWRILEAWAGE